MSLKNDILASLEENRGEFISGQTLAEKFGVSRAAVNKAVSALKAGGCDIESSTNRGYRITGDNLSEPGIRAALPEKYRETDIAVLRETDSTNSEAKRRLSSGALSGNAVIAAETQTQGRGRRGRSFFSPGGSGVYMTLVIPAETDISDAVSSTTRAACAVCEALCSLTDCDAKIKWVNDIYIDGKKVCGILTEAVSDFESGITHTLIVGIGINVKRADFPDELSEIACSLNAENLTRNEIIGAVAGAVFDAMADLKDRSYIEKYRARSCVIGREITFTGGGDVTRATAVDIDGEGGLLVRLPDGTETTLRSGEITLRLAQTDNTEE